MLDLIAAVMLMQMPDPCHAVMPRYRPARCPAWRALGNQAGNETYVDPASARRFSDSFEIAMRVVYATPQAGEVRSRVTITRFDCVQRTVARRHVRTYTMSGILLAQGDVTGAEAEAQPVRPGISGDLLGQFCPPSPTPAAIGADPCHAVPQGMGARACSPWRSWRRSDGLEVFINQPSLVRRGDNFEMLVRTVYATARGRVRSQVSRNLYDCAGRTQILLHVASYDVTGRMIEDRGPLPSEAAPAPAGRGAPADALLNQYCRR